MFIKCAYCGGRAELDMDEEYVIEDGDIIWGECKDCGQEVSVDCIITKNIGEK